MRGAAAVTGVFGLLVLTTACSELPDLVISNPCPSPARVITWDSSMPVVEVDAESSIEIVYPDYDTMALVSGSELVTLPVPVQTDQYGDEWLLALPESGCPAVEAATADVIVVDDVFTEDKSDPLRVTLYSSQPAHLKSVDEIEARLDNVGSEIVAGQGHVAITFDPPTPDGAGDFIEVDLTDGVDAALAVAGADAVTLDCMDRRCRQLEVADDGSLKRHLVVQADTPGDDIELGTFAALVVLALFIALIGTIVYLIVRSIQKRRRPPRPSWPPPTAYR